MSWQSDLLVPFLYPPTLIMKGVVRGRNSMYACGLLQARSLPAPVISIGNLTVGGSGKTPLAIYTAQLLQEMGARPALLSRGYGRDHGRDCLIIPPGSGIRAPAGTVGDEPALIRLRMPEMWLGISGDRLQAANRILERETTPVFLLDDGFQHRRLQRDLDIVVVDASQPLARNRLLPLGTLREPVEVLRRADVTVIHGEASGSDGTPPENVVRRFCPDGKIFHCRQFIDGVMPFPVWKGRGTAGVVKATLERAFLVAAIGNPLRFQRDVQAMGIEVVGVQFYRDHRWLDAGEWDSCYARARKLGAEAVLTTEKDAVKIEFTPRSPIMVAVQSTRMAEETEFRRLLKSCIEGSR